VTATTQITIEDVTKPILTLPANTTIECDADNSPAQTGSATASDNCSPANQITISFTDQTVPGACPHKYVINRTWKADDAYGNSITGVQTITVQDTKAPVITTPAQDLTLSCDGAGNTAAITAWLNNQAGATATDNCGTITWTNNYTALSDGCGASGSAVVTFSVTDQCGNSSTTQATVTIEDVTPPTITTPATSQTVECSATSNTAFNTWLTNRGGATASDICGSITWSTNPANPSLSDLCGNTGAVTVTFIATDACGNKSETTATFTIEDKTAPTITTPASNLVVECDGNGNTGAINTWLNNRGGAAATDACGTVTWSNNYMALSDGCGATGTTTVIFTATDECGNTSTTQATITINDNIAPVIVCSNNVQNLGCNPTDADNNNIPDAIPVNFSSLFGTSI
ncbi:MAG TPA: hypothetical protein VFY78_00400, partial [Gammaproteobacteria bacterium]|nr:hypothetical protein [Gammaproteobacteria bacterium]